jgi:hypothetical protein
MKVSLNLTLLKWAMFLISFCVISSTDAQPNSCGFVAPSRTAYLNSISGYTQASGITTTKMLPIHFWIVRHTNGTLPGDNSPNGSSNTLLTYLRNSINAANQVFSAAAAANGPGLIMNFYVTDIDFITNTNWHSSFEVGQIPNIFNAGNDPNAINVYVVNSFATGEAGYALSPLSAAPNNVVVVRPSDKYILGHELGHYFNLLHTFHETWFDLPTQYPAAFGGPCASSGDMICDTPVDPVCPHPNWTCSNFTNCPSGTLNVSVTIQPLFLKYYFELQ